MPRSFNGTSQYLRWSPAVALPAAGITLAAWFKPTGTTGTPTVAGLFSAGNTGDYITLDFDGSGNLELSVRKAGTFLGGTPPKGGRALVANRWQHACGRITSDGLTADCAVDGIFGAAATVGTSGVPTVTLGRLAIAVLDRNAAAPTTDWFSGLVAHVALWRLPLTSREVVELARGVSPRAIRPEALVGHTRVGDPREAVCPKGAEAYVVTGATLDAATSPASEIQKAIGKW